MSRRLTLRPMRIAVLTGVAADALLVPATAAFDTDPTPTPGATDPTSADKEAQALTDRQMANRASRPGLMSRRWWTGALALALSLGFAFMNANSVSAATYYRYVNLLRNWETGRCLDSNAAGQVYTNPCQQGNDYQTWTVAYKAQTDHDIVQIINKATQRCLYWNDNPSLVLATVPCEGVSWTQEAPASQLWRADGSSWDNVMLTNVRASKCLDSNYGGSAYIQDCNGGGYQHWKLGF